MALRDAANEWAVAPSLAATPAAVAVRATPSSTFAALLSAGAASKVYFGVMWLSVLVIAGTAG
jgi:hypothetical protein